MKHTHKKIILAFVFVFSSIGSVAQAQTVGAPTPDCWVPEASRQAFFQSDCQTYTASGGSNCEIVFPYDVVSNGVSYFGVLNAPNGICRATFPGQLPGSAFNFPSAPPPPVVVTPAQAPVYRFYRPSTGEHFFTLSQSEGINAGFNYEGIGFSVLTDASVSNTVGIYRCYWPWKGEHFISTASNCEGQVTEGLYGYLYSSQPGGSVSTAGLIRFYNPGNQDHMETENYFEGANNGYVMESVLGYAPANQ